jgi:elongation factor 1-alpha
MGHVDHGKSTTVGRLLAETNEEYAKLVEQLRAEAEKIGKATFEYAWVLDTQIEERQRGITIKHMAKEFETQKYHITILDLPGHKDFIKNMITGASQADAAVLVVAANDGIMPQTEEHARLTKIFGINQIIVAINKMDAVNYDQKRFEELKNEVTNMLKSIGWKPEEIKAIIPISAYNGDNITKKSDKMPWYNGPTLLEALDLFEEPPKLVDMPLRLPIESVYSIKGIGTVVAGRILTGTMKVGDKVRIEPAGIDGEVKSIEMHHKPMQEAVAGDNVGVNVKGVNKGDVERGDVIGPANNPPTVAKKFTAAVFIMDHPSVIGVGYQPVFHIATAQVACKFVKLIRRTNQVKGISEENPQFLEKGDLAEVELEPMKPVVVEANIPRLGQFAIRDMNRTIGAGKVLKVEPRE